MILYNITFKLEENAAKDWLLFMKDDYLPLIYKTGFIESYKILELLNDEYSDDGKTYTVQFHLENMAQLTNYQALYEAPLEEKLHNKFGGKFVFFKTWLKEVH